MVQRYGNTLFGNSTLIARRLIEAGVRFVNVTWDLFWGPVNVDYDAWDTHTNNFRILKNNKLPGFDQTMEALMTDLSERGLLSETLIVVTSEMGRTPKINGNAGRDHWTNCYGSLLAAAGIREVRSTVRLMLRLPGWPTIPCVRRTCWRLCIARWGLIRRPECRITPDAPWRLLRAVMRFGM